MVNDEQHSGNDESASSFNGRQSDSTGTHSEHEDIQSPGGMSVNERLYWFGLFDHWDSSECESRDRIRAKLRADAQVQV